MGLEFFFKKKEVPTRLFHLIRATTVVVVAFFNNIAVAFSEMLVAHVYWTPLACPGSRPLEPFSTRPGRAS